MNSVLVIGGSGFLGSNIATEVIQAQNYTVTVLDVRDPADTLEGVEYIKGSVSDIPLLTAIIKKHRQIIYLKSGTTPSTSMTEVVKAYAEDLLDLVAVCKLSSENSVEKIIFASSGGTVYAQSEYQKPYGEEDPTHPINHYGISKLACENILLMYNKLFGMNNLALRISNPYGIGQTSLSQVGAITTFAEKMSKDEPIQIFGNGETVRDYVEVSDVAGAFRLALEKKSGAAFPVYNIGSGQGFSVLQIIDLLKDYLGKEPQLEFLPKRIFDISYSVLDIRKAFQELNYQPLIMPENGIRDYVKKFETI